MGRPKDPASRPLAQRGEVAFLKVLSTNKTGALLDWGQPEPLFLPWREVKREEKPKLREGQKVMVAVYLDKEEGRVIASARLEDFLEDEAEGFREGDKVTLMIGDRTDIGVRVVVNHRHWGMVHDSDIFGLLLRGETRDGWIKALRPDRKLNIALTPPGYAKVDTLAENILAALKREGGFLPFTDKSSPEAIQARFGISKKAFKLTLSALYKQRRITLEENGIRLV